MDVLEYVVDRFGEKQAVVIPYQVFKQFVASLEETFDIGSAEDKEMGTNWIIVIHTLKSECLLK